MALMTTLWYTLLGGVFMRRFRGTIALAMLRPRYVGVVILAIVAGCWFGVMVVLTRSRDVLFDVEIFVFVLVRARRVRAIVPRIAGEPFSAMSMVISVRGSRSMGSARSGVRFSSQGLLLILISATP
jgi:hypothetical protein